MKKNSKDNSQKNKIVTKKTTTSTLKTQIKEQISDIILSNFNIDNIINKAYIYAGGTNSGKTYSAIQKLKEVPENAYGVYLAPLRMLAAEVSKKLTDEGYLCSLLTGQEKKFIQGARLISSTVEMFNYDIHYHTIVLDETQMLGEDDSRGHSWTKVLLSANCDNMYIICAPHAVNLIIKILEKTNKQYEIKTFERFTKLSVSEKLEKLSEIEDNTIVVAFSKNDILEIKEYLLNNDKKSIAIYGSLSPEIRHSQIEHFINGNAKIAVASDCIGMGVNLPAKKIVFLTTTKFNGKTQDKISQSLLRQIASRAGRYGYFNEGVVSAVTKNDLLYIKECFETEIPDLQVAYYSPSIEELTLINKNRLCDKLIEWQKLNVIPKTLKNLITPVDLTDKIEYSNLLTNEHEHILQLENCLLLINAPIATGIVPYWQDCVNAITQGKFIPKPSNIIKEKIITRDDLDYAENLIHKCELYLWLGNRKQFAIFTPDLQEIYELKLSLANKVDNALIDMRIKIQKNCITCKKPLPLFYNYKICNYCHYGYKF